MVLWDVRATVSHLSAYSSSFASIPMSVLSLLCSLLLYCPDGGSKFFQSVGITSQKTVSSHPPQILLLLLFMCSHSTLVLILQGAFNTAWWWQLTLRQSRYNCCCKVSSVKYTECVQQVVCLLSDWLIFVVFAPSSRLTKGHGHMVSSVPRIREVLGCSLSLRLRVLTEVFLWPSIFSQANAGLVQYFQLGHDCSLPHPFQFISHKSCCALLHSLHSWHCH